VLYHVETRSYSVDILVLVLTNCKKNAKGMILHGATYPLLKVK